MAIAFRPTAYFQPLNIMIPLFYYFLYDTFRIMASDEEEDDEDLDEEDIDKDDSPAFAASGALDTLAISLPADKYITSLMAQVCI